MIEISTSILGVKETAEETRIFYDLEVAKTDYFHIDVMDGKFVPEKTDKRMLEFSTIIKHISNIPLDVHLMVEDVKYYIDQYVDLLPMYITIHYESFKNKEELNEVLKYIRENNIKTGLSIKPGTPIEAIKEYLHSINMVLVMTVEPGYGGQKLIPECLEKAKSLKEYIIENNLDCYVEIDGGVNLKTIEEVKRAEVDIAVVGSAIIGAENFEKVIKELKN